ncbi:MAG: TolC family protein, partial [Bacteroidetes bacterium]|nr:TolC family protein [Bacteroidota bacterium]
MRRLLPFLTFVLLMGHALVLPVPATAQEAPFDSPPTSSDPLVLTVDEALEIALLNNYALRQARLDAEDAETQINEAWGQVLPSLSFSSQYTRNIQEPNPFAGSQAGGLFQSFGLIDWLAFNEEARTDGVPDTEPISLSEFQRRRQEGLGAAGVGTDDGNPFAVPNQFRGGLTLNQTLYSASAFAAVRGARQLREVTERGVDRETQRLLSTVRERFYQAQLATDRARIARLSVERTRETLNETARRVRQGTAPKFERLSAEV